MARIFELVNQQPVIWPMVDDSIDQWLEHRLFIQRLVRQPGNTDGTPNYDLQQWGPYDCRLATPEGSKARQPDRWTDDTHRHLAVRSDVKPQEQDYVVVFAPFLPTVPAGSLQSLFPGFTQLPSPLQPAGTAGAPGDVNAARFRVMSTTEPRNAHWLAEGSMVLWACEVHYTRES